MKVLLSLCWIMSLIVSFWLGFSYSETSASAKTGSDLNNSESESANLPQTRSLSAHTKPTETYDIRSEEKSAEQSRQYNKLDNPAESDTVKAENTAAKRPPEIIKRQTDTEIQKPTKVSAAELDGKVPAPFDQVLLNSKGSFIEQFKRFDEEPVNYEWSVLMQQRIRDYVAMHEFGGHIELESVSCKASLCEIRGFDHHGKVWSVIEAGMAVQDWWRFNSAHAARNFSEEHGQYFYSLVEVVPNAAPPN